jgi:hypothetical protein
MKALDGIGRSKLRSGRFTPVAAPQPGLEPRTVQHAACRYTACAM